MSTSRATVRGAIRGMGQRANPVFAAGAVAVPVGALAYALLAAPVVHHIYSSLCKSPHT